MCFSALQVFINVYVYASLQASLKAFTPCVQGVKVCVCIVGLLQLQLDLCLSRGSMFTGCFTK